jgi:hypothetical protein
VTVRMAAYLTTVSAVYALLYFADRKAAEALLIAFVAMLLVPVLVDEVWCRRRRRG